MAYKNVNRKTGQKPELWGGTPWEEFTRDVDRAVEVLRGGGVIVYPTDTVWGLGCDATNEDAVRRVMELKGRPEGKPLIIIVDTEQKIEGYVKEVAAVAWDIIALNVRPTTIVFEGARGLAPSVIAGDGSVGIRLTEEAYSRELCRRLGRAVVATSANRNGERTPATFGQIAKEIREGADYVAMYRRADRSRAVASQIIRMGPKGESKVIRR